MLAWQAKQAPRPKSSAAVIHPLQFEELQILDVGAVELEPAYNGLAGAAGAAALPLGAADVCAEFSRPASMSFPLLNCGTSRQFLGQTKLLRV